LELEEAQLQCFVEGVNLLLEENVRKREKRAMKKQRAVTVTAKRKGWEKLEKISIYKTLKLGIRRT